MCELSWLLCVAVSLPMLVLQAHDLGDKFEGEASWPGQW